MSRGFVREGDQKEVPIVPQRAYLPEGVANFVTPEVMDQLLKEKEEIIRESDGLTIKDENEKHIVGNLLDKKVGGSAVFIQTREDIAFKVIEIFYS